MFSISWYCSKSRKTIEITDTKLIVPVGTLSTQDDVKPHKELDSCFKRAINWNKSKTTNQAQNRSLDFSSDASFQEENRLFAYHLNSKMVEKVILSFSCGNKPL